MHKRTISKGATGLKLACAGGDDAWIGEAYAASCDARWTPDAVAMDLDAAQWRAAGALGESERRVVRHFLGFLTTMESQEKAVLLALYQRTDARACRQVLLHRLFEENLHASAGRRITAALGIDPDDALAGYRAVCGDAAESLMAPDDAMDDDRQLLRSLIVHACLIDGLVYAGILTPVIVLGSGGRMPGTAEQCCHILRDQARHCDFGIGMANALRRANPGLWDAHFSADVETLFRRAAELACRSAESCVAPDASWIDVTEFKRYLCHETNRRARQLGLPALFEEAVDPYAWMV